MFIKKGLLTGLFAAAMLLFNYIYFAIDLTDKLNSLDCIEKILRAPNMGDLSELAASAVENLTAYLFFNSKRCIDYTAFYASAG
jgi:hypothetical protein